MTAMLTAANTAVSDQDKLRHGALAQSFEQYCLMRALESELRTEESYEFVKFMLALQGLKDRLNEIGIINLIPVGSAVTKSIRRDCFMVDVILNFNQASLFPHLNEHTENISDEQLAVRFHEMVSQIEHLFRTALAPQISPHSLVGAGSQNYRQHHLEQ